MSQDSKNLKNSKNSHKDYRDSKNNSDSKALVFLAQTDTTAGLLSSDYKRLNAIKKRKIDQKVLLELSDFKILKSLFRIPKSHKIRVRRARKTSFILPNSKSFRVVKDSTHLMFLRQFGALYSTSANESGKKFDLAWAIQNCDVVVLDSRGFSECKASSIFKLGKHRLKRIRK